MQVASINKCLFCMDAARWYVMTICDPVWLVASEHLNNLTNIGLGFGSDRPATVPIGISRFLTGISFHPASLT